MHILVVGNVLKDVYLNLDTRTEPFETDRYGIKWLNLGFNASEHRFFNRESSLGGAAVSLEVLNNIGLKTSIADSSLTYADGSFNTNYYIDAHRYILISDGQVSYLAPSEYKITNFSAPAEAVDYLFVDRSAELSESAAKQIVAYLGLSQKTKLVLYLRNLDNPHLNQLISQSSLVFLEYNRDNSEKLDALKLEIPPEKLIHISENQFSYLNIFEHVSVERIDLLTHLSTYSIAAATILGGFVLGNSVEDSLKMARVNLEHSKLNSTLTLDELKKFSEKTNPSDNLNLIAANLVLKPKGILAADESGGSIEKKFAQLNIPDTYDNRRDYRNLFFSTPDLEQYVNGAILFDETTHQLADNGQNFVDYLTSKRIIPGIKVDQGLAPFNNTEEKYTKGLDDLPERLKTYYLAGLRFAKWRAAFEIRLSEKGETLTPTPEAISENCRILAEYAKECQSAGLVPIVEPEVVYDGNYSIEKCAETTGVILDNLFEKLESFGVNLRACLLKVNMILAGKQSESQSTPEEVGQKTAEVLKNHVPAELAGVVFLSGGQTPDQATDNLASIIANGPFPWPVTFSFARALQDPALYTWQGDNENAEPAKQAFLEQLKKNKKAISQ